MRELKFRVNDPITNEMYFTDSDEVQLIFGKVNDNWSLWSDFGKIIDGSEGELSQFTGLYDKNGKEIYEGDIVGYLRLNKIYAEEEYDIAVVEFNADLCRYELSRERFFYNKKKVTFSALSKYGQPVKQIEVLGNVYQDDPIDIERKKANL